MDMVTAIPELEGITERFVRLPHADSGIGFFLLIGRGPDTLFESPMGLDVDSSTIFPLASVSKQFIGAAILDLAASGEISLGESIRTFFPSYELRKEITVLDLLNHTSGIGEYIYLPSEAQLDSWSLSECSDFILRVSPNRLDASFGYSNSNYVLLTSILEKVTEITYSKYLRKRIFDPLGMTNTFTFDDLITSPQRIAWSKISLRRTFFGWGDAGLFSSAGDLSKWFRSDLFLVYENHACVLSPLESSYGAGMNFKLKRGEGFAFHSGATVGASCLIIHNREKRQFLILLANHPDSDGGDLIPEVMNMLLL